MFNNKNLFIALTYKCNAFCKKCMTRYHINRKTDISIDILNRIFSLLIYYSYCGWISVGTGEPLLYDNFQYFVKSILKVNSNIKLRLLTNGMLLFCDNPIAIFDDRIKWGVTMDAFKQDSLINVQKGVDIEKVKWNVRDVAKKYGGSQMYLNFTVYEHNIEEILSFCKFAVENGITEIYLTELKVFSGYEKDLQDYRVIHDDYLSGKLDEVKEFLSKNNISTGGINIGRSNNRCKCYLKNTASPIIDVDGSVSFCSGREDIFIGNIMDEEIVEKWKSHIEFINQYEPAWCSKCYDKIRENGIYNLPKTIRKEQ